MSDLPPGPGWWKASDGNWYPPQPAAAPAPPPPQPPPPPKSNKGCLIALAIVFGLLAVGGVATVVAVTYLGHRAADKLHDLGEAATTPQTVDPAHLGARNGDHVLQVGKGVESSGFTGTVKETRFATSYPGLPDGSYLVADVSVENRDDHGQTNDPTVWHLQQPDGSLAGPVFSDHLNGGELGPGERVEGTLVFQVGDAPGDYYVTYWPDVFDRSRGIWTVKR